MALRQTGLTLASLVLFRGSTPGGYPSLSRCRVTIESTAHAKDLWVMASEPKLLERSYRRLQL